MRSILQKSSYEKLIGQMVYIEENMPSIQEGVIQASKADIKYYFERYIKKIEALFENIIIADDKDQLNRIPFIVLDSSFTLRDTNNRAYYCHLSYENTMKERESTHQIYFLSETGLTLLLKEEGSTATVNMGKGYLEHKISSVRII